MELIDRAERLQEVYGRWPSFHDSEIEIITLLRGPSGEEAGPTIQINISLWETTPEVDGRGFYSRRNFTVATLVLYSAEIVHLIDFNHQNVIYGLNVDEVSGPERMLRITLDPSFGVSAEFLCRRAEIVSVERRALPTHAA